MGTLLQHRRGRHRLPTITAFSFLLFSSFSTVALAHPGAGAPEHQQKGDKENGLSTPPRTATTLAEAKRITGPGSSPPSCRSKCGWCTPCKPVHVAIQPGLSFPLEYYPEAWRCKCGNKLFMP
ncbi:hypothetical protein L6164_012786 [Bauhinia variegata]|uniref:Uncharacterized protein n=1 Tax=Bauhinia variegata TaxID=167791 RepID=A0ACB9PBF8_BAUVA|nr:hypothetical protein L6164_012786 [Bauhinia variegata]